MTVRASRLHQTREIKGVCGSIYPHPLRESRLRPFRPYFRRVPRSPTAGALMFARVRSRLALRLEMSWGSSPHWSQAINCLSCFIRATDFGWFCGIVRGARGGKTPDTGVQGHTSPFPRGVDCWKSRPSARMMDGNTGGDAWPALSGAWGRREDSAALFGRRLGKDRRWRSGRARGVRRVLSVRRS